MTGLIHALYSDEFSTPVKAISFAEITMNSPEAVKSIKLAAKHFNSDEICIGAGTVLTPEHAESVAVAGGQYIISPSCNGAVIRHTKELGLLSCSRVFTLSEVFTAFDAGADILKLFPAGRLSPEYIKDYAFIIKILSNTATSVFSFHSFSLSPFA